MLPLRAARRVAVAVRRSELGRQAAAGLRPRGIYGMLRERAPLSLILYAAALDGRLVWRGPEAFALLEPPYGSRTRGRPAGLSRMADRYWELLTMMVPPAALLGLALLLVALRQWSPVALWAALLAALLAMLHVCVLMTAMVVTIFVRWAAGLPLRREREWRAAGDLRFLHWSMPLFHCADADEAPILLERAKERLRDLVRAQVVHATEDVAARTRTVEVNELLLCLPVGATSAAARDEVVKASVDAAGPGGTGVRFMATGSRPAIRLAKPFESGSFLGLYLMGLVVIVLAEAVLVADAERDACGTDCAGRPAGYPEAVRWLAWRLIGGNPADLIPVTAQAWTVGWLTTIAAWMVPLILLVTAVRMAAAHKERMARFVERMNPVLGTTTVLIMVATPVERQAVLEAIGQVTGEAPRRRDLRWHTAFELGVVSGAQVLLAQTRPGSTEPGAATLTAQSLIDQLDPDYLLLTGICYGLVTKKQKLGDILVCTQLRVMDHKKIAEPALGRPVERLRGDRVTPSVTLLDRCQNARLTQEGPAVHFGPLLSGNVLLDSPTERQRMIEAEPEAIGGEMEGLGVYAAAAKDKVDWIVVKAIADWGMDKDDTWQPIAARNAAEFMVDVLQTGGLDHPPISR
ncbi:hypothetical protein ACFWY5_17955 [Nonomuraea sp. NPDC059007]|uniref:phosphorylase family protein n=1 Tax=Nonomuraea sp. NPDC059007 TaxID=3346692 RepID=UPI003684F4F4